MNKKQNGKRANINSLMVQANIKPEQVEKAHYDIVSVPNPNGEVFIDGHLKRHSAVAKKPLYHTLWRRGVIDHRTYAVLEWYDQKCAASEVSTRSSSDFSGGGGGGAGSHIPITEASLAARDEIEWARDQIPIDALPSFDAVMVDEISFVESARRDRANRYIRASIRTAQRKEKTAFMRATDALVKAWHKRFGAVSRGIVASTY